VEGSGSVVEDCVEDKDDDDDDDNCAINDDGKDDKDVTKATPVHVDGMFVLAFGFEIEIALVSLGFLRAKSDVYF
jgi:hypothetical protein